MAGSLVWWAGDRGRGGNEGYVEGTGAGDWWFRGGGGWVGKSR